MTETPLKVGRYRAEDSSVQSVHRPPRSLSRRVSSVALATATVAATLLTTFSQDRVQSAASSVLEIQVAGEQGVPDDATAAVINIAAARASSPGYVTAWPCGEDEPFAASLNYRAGSPISNSTIIKLGSAGKICLRSSSPTDLIVDVNAAFDDSAGLESFNPRRVVDTRETPARSNGNVVRVPINTLEDVPDQTTAAVLNIAAVGRNHIGHVTAYPCSDDRPTTASLNYFPSGAVSNATTIDVGSTGEVCLWTSSPVDLVVDLNAVFTGTIEPFTPVRLLDTRTGGTNNAGSTQRIAVAGTGQTPADSRAAVLNIAASRADVAGFVVAHPCDDERPNAASLNYDAGQNISNTTVISLGTTGEVCLWTSSKVDLIVDVNGVFPTESGVDTFTPGRLVDTREDDPPSEPNPTPGPDTPSPNPPTTPTTPPTPPTPPTPVPSGASFVETFDGNTGIESFDTGVYHRDEHLVWRTSWPGDHDLGCNSPDTSRTIQRDTDDWRYTCRDHLMTAIGDTSGYSTGWFEPKETFSGQREVSWDVNITDLGPRQWWEVMIVPAEFESGLSDCPHCAAADWLSPSPSGLPAYPSDSVVVGNGPFGRDIRVFSEGRDHQVAEHISICSFDPEGCASKAIRRPFSMTDNANGTITVDYGGFAEFTIPGSFPDRFHVVFKDHNYTPEKDNDPVGFTWHWDNIIVSG